jgi:3'-phosphoadenosine 5'-phosphosulfate sulfotransferase (PAPS reductase)/FAD synthetase
MSKKQIILFGGGKDSLALLYYMYPMLDDTLVVFGDTGAIYPHMRRFVVETCKALEVELKVVYPPHGDAIAWIKKFGAPADVVPIDYTKDMQPMLRFRKQPIVQSRMLCCSANLWTPVQKFILKSGIKQVYRGSKACDEKRGLGPKTSFADVVVDSPLWDWTDEQVFAFLKECDVSLPEHYKKVNTSFDCFCCSAYLNDKGAADRIRYTKEHYPNFYPVLEENLSTVGQALKESLTEIGEALR